MKLQILTPKQSLNKAYLKEKVTRTDIELFKKNLLILLNKINEQESEEHHKYPVSDFLKDTWYKDLFEINTKGRSDFVIHNGKTTKDPVGVIIEVKRPTNKTEMMSAEKPNAKAMHELILYYLQERIIHLNTGIKYLVATNIHEWFIIDEVWFDKNIYRNSKLRKQYEDDYKRGGHDTKFFYDSIAKTFLETLEEPVPCTYFNIKDFEKELKNDNAKDDNKLIALYKILSPAHLLKQPFGNDSNSLDPKFYSELLHIIGLEEVKDGGKKLIKRKQKPDDASLLENTILKLEDKESLHNLSNLYQYGNTRQEQLFSVALELCITWINRVLFLKLLEAQLVNYHKGDTGYQFLNTGLIHDYDELNNLFFQVLAEKTDTRKEYVKEKFGKIPYLNSSLFERTDLERKAFDIGGLDNRLELPLSGTTVLKNEQGKRKTGKMGTLAYLFDFLNAYDFTSEGSEEIQEENKNLINASVLGLIFEKINGYKDGSFFTPGFITMYMCRETIRRAVVQKFNEKHGIDCEHFDDLKNFVSRRFKPKDILEHNALINSLKICDPAVGSGHFLVSALNELIAVKAELNILADKEGRLLSGYEVKIENDELIITYNNNTEIFEYTITNNSVDSNIQRVQKTLFHEKETLIENCLFGVDINPNSVKICRLRLWIELLKNAYYTKESHFRELETLPNIDINIKCGNSLISRFDLDVDLGQALKKSKWNIDTYKLAVHSYHHSKTKEEKREIEELIKSIKSNFETEIAKYSDPRVKKLQRLGEQLFTLTGKGRGGTTTILFDQESKNEKNKELAKKRKKEIEKIEAEIQKLKSNIVEVKSNKIYENAFEWRFEFPEVLDNDGSFFGFDVVIGNPPYVFGGNEGISEAAKELFKKVYVTGSGKINLFTLFIEHSFRILKDRGNFSFIVPNTYLRVTSYHEARKLLIHNNKLFNIYDFGNSVFDDAVTTAIVLIASKEKPTEDHLIEVNNNSILNQIKQSVIESSNYVISTNINSTKQVIIDKLEQKSIKLGAICREMIFGVVITKNKELIVSENNVEGWKPFLEGKDIGAYYIKPIHSYLNYDPKLLHRARTKEVFESEEKILIQRITGGTQPLKAAYDDKKIYNKESINNIILNENCQYSSKFILALINSKLINWYYSKRFTNDSTLTVNLSKEYLSQIPIVKVSTKEQQRIEVIVDKILKVKSSNYTADILTMENEINELVYQLYDLTEEEIKIVEEASK